MSCIARRKACLRYSSMSSYCIAVAAAYCNTLIISVHVKSLQVVSQPEEIVSCLGFGTVLQKNVFRCENCLVSSLYRNLEQSYCRAVSSIGCGTVMQEKVFSCTVPCA